MEGKKKLDRIKCAHHIQDSCGECAFAADSRNQQLLPTIQ
jgi:hypothetical protein